MKVLGDISQYDQRMLLWCGKSRYFPQFIRAVRAVSRSGDGYLQLLLPPVMLVIDPLRGKVFLLMATVAFAIERLLYYVLKNVFKRRRPPQVVPSFNSIIHASDEFSFPSGHTMAAFVLAGCAGLSFGLAAAPLYVWATAVGISRVILGVHFPTDILAGASLGTAIALLAPHLT